MADNLVIVESPAKARTIKKYLGRDFEVLASYGHVRDLVPKEGAVDPDTEQLRWVVLMVLSSQPGYESAVAQLGGLMLEAPFNAPH